MRRRWQRPHNQPAQKSISAHLPLPNEELIAIMKIKSAGLTLAAAAIACAPFLATQAPPAYADPAYDCAQQFNVNTPQWMTCVQNGYAAKGTGKPGPPTSPPGVCGGLYEIDYDNCMAGRR